MGSSKLSRQSSPVKMFLASRSPEIVFSPFLIQEVLTSFSVLAYAPSHYRHVRTTRLGVSMSLAESGGEALGPKILRNISL